MNYHLIIVLSFLFLSFTSLEKAQIENIRLLESRIIELQQKYSNLLPKKPYLIVSTTDNQIQLMSRDSILLKSRCSTGSYILLKAPGNREWLFKTPRGAFKVNVKLKNPWWYKPDWAYIEEDEPIPSLESPRRYQDGVLGDFALGFGDGYLIHGTLYTRLLGMPVTHGCVRLDDDAMRFVYEQMTHGCKIFIY
jgi:L,D-transpeptidase ErfK/SrfK